MSRLEFLNAVAAFVVVCTAAFAPASLASWSPSEGRELIGTPAPPFSGLHWVTQPPLTLIELHGKVVLVRFWLSGCPLCQNSAPVFNYLYKRYGKDGLVVIGIHHPKSRTVKDPAVVRAAARKLGFTFPIAQDNRWQTIDRYWLGAHKRSYTSASFLIDKHGIIRWIHDGGTLSMPASEAKGTAFQSLEQNVQQLLAEQGGND